MVETAIYALLGALATALVFLLAIPAISRRALRLAQRRASLAAPLSAAQALADRDALRAKHAVEIALIERRAAAADERSAQAQIAFGRQAGEIVARDATLAEQVAELARRRDEIGRLVEEVRLRDAEIAAREIALHDYAGQREAAERRAAEATERVKASLLRFDSSQADLEARIAALSRDLSDARREAAAAETRAADLARQLEASEAVAERMKAQAASAPSQAADPFGSREHELGLRVQELRSANGEAEAALRAARADREKLARELADLRDRLAESESRVESDAELRQTIARLGRELVAAPAEREPAS